MSAERRTGNMKTNPWKIISGIAFATVLASTTPISVLAEPKEKPRGIEGVWHVTVTVVQVGAKQSLAFPPISSRYN